MLRHASLALVLSATLMGCPKKGPDLNNPVEGHHCIIIEDIVDTGLTLDYLLKMLRVRGPASLKTCALLDKATRREVDVEADFVGFSIPDEFVVGFGLDLGERFRNLPHVAVYTP